jgi:hypothetical protein
MKRTITINFFINLLLIVFFLWLLIFTTSCNKQQDATKNKVSGNKNFSAPVLKS